MTWRYEYELLAKSRSLRTFFSVFLFLSFAMLIVILLDVSPGCRLVTIGFARDIFVAF